MLVVRVSEDTVSRRLSRSIIQFHFCRQVTCQTQTQFIETGPSDPSALYNAGRATTTSKRSRPEICSRECTTTLSSESGVHFVPLLALMLLTRVPNRNSQESLLRVKVAPTKAFVRREQLKARILHYRSYVSV